MAINSKIGGDEGELIVSGRFVFSDSSEFRNVLSNILNAKVKFLKINLADLNFMDSSGLGMLMVAEKECEKANVAMSIFAPQGSVKSLLQITKSYDRFKIVDR